MRITAIIRNPNNVPDGTPCVFTLEDATVTGGPVVSDIMFCRDGFANGPGKDPVYVVKYDEIPEVTQIPAGEIVDVSVNPDAKKTAKKAESPEAAVELPE